MRRLQYSIFAISKTGTTSILTLVPVEQPGGGGQRSCGLVASRSRLTHGFGDPITNRVDDSGSDTESALQIVVVSEDQDFLPPPDSRETAPLSFRTAALLALRRATATINCLRFNRSTAERISRTDNAPHQPVDAVEGFVNLVERRRVAEAQISFAPVPEACARQAGDAGFV